MQTPEPAKWVVIEVQEVDSQPQFLISPEELHLPFGWRGEIVWYVFTPGWELSRTGGVKFPTGSGFKGMLELDPLRPGCWRTEVANDAPGRFPYIVNVHRTGSADRMFRVDPVVENDPPTPPREIDARAAGVLAHVS